MICPLCKREFARNEKNVLKCKDCETDFMGIFVGGWRESALQKLVKDYKYKSVRACAEVLVEILAKRLPDELGENVTVVPLPTIGRHVRERGFDHTWLLAKKLAKRRGWKCQRILGRATKAVQVGAKAAERMKQAAETYEVVGEISETCRYLLLDDVWTTGASMLAAGRVMKEGGAKELMAVVVETGRDEAQKRRQ